MRRVFANSFSRRNQRIMTPRIVTLKFQVLFPQVSKCLTLNFASLINTVARTGDAQGEA